MNFDVDTFDSVTWPRDGTRVRASYSRSLESFGADVSGHFTRIEAGSAGTIGRNILLGSFEASSSTSGTENLNSRIFLGGFLRLSGLARNQLVGDKGGIARLLYYRELTRFDLGSMTQRMYAGFSLETGNVYGSDDPVTWASLRRAGSVFVGADTIVGPAYLGYGYSDGGNSVVYLIIGQRF